MSLEIDLQALTARLDTLAGIGAIDNGGVCRLALSDADKLGRDQLVQWMHELGLTVEIDRIGNIFGTRPGSDAEAAPVMTGSHIDTVATGGRYDGSYGVMAGLEVLRLLNLHGVPTKRAITVAAFSNEEGVRYMPDMMGSLVHAGGLPLDEALATVGTDGSVLGEELQRIGYAGAVPVGRTVPHAYIELHIEQGPVLETEGIQIGAVQDLQGISWQRIEITGQSNHAGTTPMRMRRDAGYCAAAIAVFVRDMAKRFGGGQVATVGSIELHPNLINVIPSRASLTVDLRNAREPMLRRAEGELAQYLARLVHEESVQIESKPLARFEPVRFDARLVRLIEVIAAEQRLTYMHMSSGAGHDAQMMARICPSAMIFVPSHQGLSHNPHEHTEPADLARGAGVLLEVLRRLADE